MPNFFMPRFPFQHNYNYYTPIPKPNPRTQTLAAIEPIHQNSTLSQDRQSFSQDNLKDTRQKQSPFLEIFGLELFFDDILLLSLIFFLYSEGVKDDMLFVTLILLLLS